MQKIKLYSTALSILLFLGACVEQRPEVEEKLGSFNVTIDYEKSAVPGDPYATCAYKNDMDLCPGAVGSLEKPISFPADQWAHVYVDIEAIGSKGTKPWPLTGEVALGLHQGTLFGASRKVELTDGRVEDFLVRFKSTPGPTYIWVEDSIPRYDENEEPGFAAGTTMEPLIFDQPSILEIQRTDDECCSDNDGQRVKIERGNVYISRMFGTTFNLQDADTLDWSGLFVFSFRAVEGVRVGSKLMSVAGAITEFQGQTQMTGPVMVAVHNLCGAENETIGENNVVKDCPPESECKEWMDGRMRCQVPDSDMYDQYGRRMCDLDVDCEGNTSCQEIVGEGEEGDKFCQIKAVGMPPVGAFPPAGFCGPSRSSGFTNDNGELTIEILEGSLVRLKANSSQGIRIGGLPACKMPEGDNPLQSVRSTCNLADDQGKPVQAVDCTVAVSGDTLLRDENGEVCFRGNQACRAIGGENGYLTVNSTCNADRNKGFCTLAEPGESVLKDANGQICRGTMDDFLSSGFAEFAQTKVQYDASDEESFCATVNFSALQDFDVFESMEADKRWQSVIGTLRQVRFSSGTSFWNIDVRYPEDLESLTVAED